MRRAYKLGKKRWSYNQCALTLQQRGGYKSLSVAEAMSNGHQSLPDDQQVNTTPSTHHLGDTNELNAPLRQ